MVLLPTPLKAFTDTMWEVKAMLRICARYLYDWHCDHKSLVDAIATVEGWGNWDSYPISWPRAPGASMPLGVVKLDVGIRQSAARRLAQIRSDLVNAGSHYPREEVRNALEYWNIEL
jgi:hypothetical protein